MFRVKKNVIIIKFRVKFCFDFNAIVYKFIFNNNVFNLKKAFILTF